MYLKEQLQRIGFTTIINLNPNPRGVDHALQNYGFMIYPHTDDTYIYLADSHGNKERALNNVEDVRKLFRDLTGRIL